MTVPVPMLLHRNGTDAFIGAASTPIVLTPVSESWVGGSKTMASGDDREVQNFRIIWAPSTGIVRTASESAPAPELRSAPCALGLRPAPWGCALRLGCACALDLRP